jgi:aspartate racemase
MAHGEEEGVLMAKRVGILGGMGPMATVDFFRKLVEETPAQCDEDHLPVVVYSVPQMPSRNAAIMQNGPSPLPEMLAGLQALEAQGAELVAIPCNTAHYWYEALCREGGLPIMHIVDAVCDALGESGSAGGPVGLMSTEATLAARIYHDRLARHGFEPLVNPPDERDRYVNVAIDLVKRNRPVEAGALARAAVESLIARGARKIVLGCTELPVALEAGAPESMQACIDATRALARATVSRALRGPRPAGARA